MARAEHPEKYSWWLNELESLGVNARLLKRVWYCIHYSYNLML
jgi:hypothetical protein